MFRSRGLVALGIVLGLLLVPSGTAVAASTSHDTALAPFYDDIEGGTGNFVFDTVSGNPWAVVTTQSHTPTRSLFSDDPAVVTDKRVALANNVLVGAGSTLSFFMRWDVEPNFDGIVLEYTLDNGTTWTDIMAAQGSVPADLTRITQTPYNSTISTAFQSPIGGRRAWSLANLTFAEIRVNLAAFSGLNARFRWRFASDNSVADVGVWVDTIRIAAALEPIALAVDTVGNNVLELAENADMAPSWQNATAAAVSPTGALSNFTGPAGPTYTINDGAASYGTIAPNGIASCGANCYGVRVTAATRPATHLDATVTETMSVGGITKVWSLHVGGSFSDVPTTNPFYRFIETLLHKGVTTGCTATAYCPAAATTREQMAVFVLVARMGSGYTPPACGATPMFTDVPVSSPFCPWITELANRGVVAGCGGSNYCPTQSVVRDAMAVFVLRTLDSTLNPAACGTPQFADVPASSPFCRWVEELARRGVVTGCGGGNYCPTNPVTREQMGVFLSGTFSLTLYGI